MKEQMAAEMKSFILTEPQASLLNFLFQCSSKEIRADSMGNCKSYEPPATDSRWWVGTPRQPRTGEQQHVSRSKKAANRSEIPDFDIEELTSAEVIIRKELQKEEKKARSSLLAMALREEKLAKVAASRNSIPQSVVTRSASARPTPMLLRETTKSASHFASPSSSLDRDSTTEKSRADRLAKKRTLVEEAEVILRLQEAVERERRRVKAAEQLLEEEQKRAQLLAEKELHEEIERVYRQEQLKKKEARKAEKRQAVLEREAQIQQRESEKRAAKEAAKVAEKAAAAARERKARDEEREARLQKRKVKESRDKVDAPVPVVAAEAAPNTSTTMPQAAPTIAPEEKQTTLSPAAPPPALPPAVVLSFDHRTGRMIWIPPSQ